MGKVRIFGFYFPVLFLVLAVAECALVSASVVFAAAIRFNGNAHYVERALGVLDYRSLLVGVVMVLALAAMGLYQTRLREGFTGQIVRIMAAFLIGWVFLALLYYLVPDTYIGRGVGGLAFIFSLLSIAVLRPVFFKLVDNDSLKPQVLVYGAGEKATWILERLQHRADRRGFRLKGFINAGGVRSVYGDVAVFDLEEPLCDYAQRHNVDQIVIAVDDRRNSLPMQDLLQCRLAGIEVLELPTFFERETGTVALELTDPSWLVFGQGFNHSIILMWLKRVLDIAISIILLVMLSPLAFLAMIAIKLEEGIHAPVIYAQTRVGERGRLFQLYKLRSMRVDAERETGARWAQSNDERVTRVGKVIRKLRLDEFPQVFNVLRGDMSFVGPRPERPEFTRHLEQQIRYYRERSAVKPGVTGWAQLRYPYGASETDSQEKLKYDLFYIKNQNMIFDILILLQTVEVVLFGKGAR